MESIEGDSNDVSEVKNCPVHDQHASESQASGLAGSPGEGHGWLALAWPCLICWKHSLINLPQQRFDSFLVRTPYRPTQSVAAGRR